MRPAPVGNRSDGRPTSWGCGSSRLQRLAQNPGGVTLLRGGLALERHIPQTRRQRGGSAPAQPHQDLTKKEQRLKSRQIPAWRAVQSQEAQLAYFIHEMFGVVSSLVPNSDRDCIDPPQILAMPSPSEGEPKQVCFEGGSWRLSRINKGPATSALPCRLTLGRSPPGGLDRMERHPIHTAEGAQSWPPSVSFFGTCRGSHPSSWSLLCPWTGPHTRPWSGPPQR
jgi:hypothetical protein